MLTGLKPGAVGTVEFSDLLANGQAVGRFEGMVVFVDGPLPGERARVRLTEVKAKYAVGELLDRETTSPDRAEPFCPVFGACGGCQVQHLAYPAQLAWKHRIVADALVRIGGFTGVERAAADRHGRSARVPQQDGPGRGRDRFRAGVRVLSRALARSGRRSIIVRSCWSRSMPPSAG